MADNRKDDKLIWITLSAEKAAHYEQRAEAAGRTLEDQLRYELETYFGLALPDPGDVEAAQRSQLFRRMSQGRILQG
jgi:hypothetical protein